MKGIYQSLLRLLPVLTLFFLSGSGFAQKRGVHRQQGSALGQQRSAPAQHHATGARPNIIFILVDDLGQRDLGVYGSSFYETPNLDRLASEGMRFTDAYAGSPICSPSRSSIMTGQYPTRTGITDWIVGRQNQEGPEPDNQLLAQPFEFDLDTAQVTIAEALKQGGYSTFFAGKWHLGLSEPYWPENQGFEVNKGGWAAGNPKDYGMGGYFSPYHNPKLPDGPAGEFLTDRLTTEAIQYILQNKNAAKPFFVELSFYAVHTPLEAKPEYIKKFKEKAHAMGLDSVQQFVRDPWMRPGGKERIVQANPVYAGLLYSVDENVGRIMTALKQSGLSDNTVVIFTSDNGGLSTSEGSPTSNAPLRYGKGWNYEGGVRIPLIVKWPKTAAAGAVCHSPVINTDLYPTFLQMAGMPLMPAQHKDGVSMSPLLKGESPGENPGENPKGQRVLYWHYPHYSNQGGSPSSALRAGDWKLVQFYENDHIELYNLAWDPGEQRDLANAFPEKTGELLELLNAWKKETKAKIPLVNPYYNPNYREVMKARQQTFRQYLSDYDTLFDRSFFDPQLMDKLNKKFHDAYNPHK
ncbi:MAG TPA: sulfatase [Puia sp.]|jgi:arylsulfatase A-like enzyme